jgi:hypothetical protein
VFVWPFAVQVHYAHPNPGLMLMRKGHRKFDPQVEGNSIRHSSNGVGLESFTSLLPCRLDCDVIPEVLNAIRANLHARSC